MTPSAEVKAWLRRSVDLLLPRFNLTGEGFEYGRSIGTYGETAFLEVLTAAARLKVLTPIEERMAYAFSTRIAARYADFWTDPESGSVDMWAHGRRTDAYRGIHRIFGENLSLARQFLYTNAIWNDLGYRGRSPDKGYAGWLATLPRVTATWFARGAHDRALVTIRDRGHVIGLPIINGAEGQHMNTPYFPVPFAAGMLQGSADATYPHLVPRITLSDGSVLMPLAWFRDVKIARRGARTQVSWRQDELDLMGAKDARPDKRATIVTRYSFTSGRIVRQDRLKLTPGISVARIDMEFASFSRDPIISNRNDIRFGSGEVKRFSVTGLTCEAGAGGERYRAPTGPFRSVIRCASIAPKSQGREIALGWTLSYN
jgi:hypothetical protein